MFTNFVFCVLYYYTFLRIKKKWYKKDLYIKKNYVNFLKCNFFVAVLRQIVVAIRRPFFHTASIRYGRGSLYGSGRAKDIQRKDNGQFDSISTYTCRVLSTNLSNVTCFTWLRKWNALFLNIARSSVQVKNINTARYTISLVLYGILWKPWRDL